MKKLNLTPEEAKEFMEGARVASTPLVFGNPFTESLIHESERAEPLVEPARRKTK
jgi:hypothetical protein